MQEFGDSAEYITSALAQQEELERATTPRELMESVSKGLWSVMMLESDGIQISSALHTLLESVRKEIVTMHTDFCIPLHYKHWWEQAKQEFASEIVELEAIHQTFKAHPCSDETEFQSLLAAIALAKKGHSTYRTEGPHRDYDEGEPLSLKPIDLISWREEEIQKISNRIEDMKATEQKLRDHAPHGFAL